MLFHICLILCVIWMQMLEHTGNHSKNQNRKNWTMERVCVRDLVRGLAIWYVSLYVMCHNNWVMRGKILFLRWALCSGIPLAHTPPVHTKHITEYKWILQHHAENAFLPLQISIARAICEWWVKKHFLKVRKCCFACVINEKRYDYDHQGCVYFVCSILRRVSVSFSVCT